MIEDIQEARRSINHRLCPERPIKDLPYPLWVTVTDDEKTGERFGYSASCVASGALRRLPPREASEMAEEMSGLDDRHFNPRERQRREERAAALLRSAPSARDEDIILAKVRRAMRDSAVYNGHQHNRPKIVQVDVVNQFFKNSMAVLRTVHGLVLKSAPVTWDGNKLINIFMEHSQELAAARLAQGVADSGRVRIAASTSSRMRTLLADEMDRDSVAHSLIINDEVEIYGRPAPNDRDRRSFILQHIT